MPKIKFDESRRVKKEELDPTRDKNARHVCTPLGGGGGEPPSLCPWFCIFIARWVQVSLVLPYFRRAGKFHEINGMFWRKKGSPSGVLATIPCSRGARRPYNPPLHAIVERKVHYIGRSACFYRVGLYGCEMFTTIRSNREILECGFKILG